MYYMIKIFHVTVFLIIANVCLNAQQFNALEQATSEHITIEGSNVSMIPPPEFAPSENFKGFQNPEDPYSMIMLLEIPGPYEEISTGFNEEKLKEQNMTLLSKKEIIINDTPGLFIELDQEASGITFSKYLIIYGKEATTLINGVYLKENKEVGNLIKEAMLSTYIDNSLSVDKRVVLKYNIDESAGNMKFNAVMGNSIMFNRDGKIPTESKDGLSLIVDESYAEVDIKDKKVFCLGRLRNMPGSYAPITQKGIKEIEINGFEGFELFGKNNENKKEEVYQVVLFKEGGGYYLFFASYLRDGGQSLEDVKKVIATFEVK